MINRFISTIGLISLTSVAGMLATTTTVNAQTVDSGEVEMTATVGSFCLFEGEFDGNLGVAEGDLTTLSSALEANGITAEDGAAGTIEVTCNNASSTINIDSVSESIPSGIASVGYTATVSGTSLASDIESADGAAGTAVAIGSTDTETLTVNLDAEYDSNVIPGTYTYTVNLVANP